MEESSCEGGRERGKEEVEGVANVPLAAGLLSVERGQGERLRLCYVAVVRWEAGG